MLCLTYMVYAFSKWRCARPSGVRFHWTAKRPTASSVWYFLFCDLTMRYIEGHRGLWRDFVSIHSFSSRSRKLIKSAGLIITWIESRTQFQSNENGRYAESVFVVVIFPELGEYQISVQYNKCITKTSRLSATMETIKTYCRIITGGG